MNTERKGSIRAAVPDVTVQGVFHDAARVPVTGMITFAPAFLPRLHLGEVLSLHIADRGSYSIRIRKIIRNNDLLTIGFEVVP